MARPIWEQYSEEDLKKAGLLPEEASLPAIDLGPEAGRIPAGLPEIDYNSLPPQAPPAAYDDSPAIKPSEWRKPAPPAPAGMADSLAARAGLDLPKPVMAAPKAAPSRLPAGPSGEAPGTSNEELVKALSGSLGNDNEDYRNKLKQAMKDRDRNYAKADFSDAANQLSNALTGMNLDASANVKAQRERADNPIKDLDKMYEGRKNDPKSDISQAYRAFFKKLGYDFGDNLSAEDLEKISPQVNQLEISKQSADARKEAARMHAETLAESRATRKDTTDLARADRLAKEGRLSEPQLKDVNQFDDSIEKMNTALGLLGKHKDWVGPVDGRIADVITPADQTAFRSAAGRMEDAYRHLITGAGASNQELARLQSRLPSATDSYEQFQAKAKAFVDEVKKAKTKHLSNYAKAGKNVSEYLKDESQSVAAAPAAAERAPASPPQAHPQDSQALAWAKAHPNDPRASEILRKNGL